MTLFQRRVALRVLAIHVGAVLALLMFAGLKGCFRPKPKNEIVTYVDFGAPAPAVAAEEVPDMPDPAPSEPPPVVEEAPPPPPEPAKIPEQPKKTVAKKPPPPKKKVEPAPPKKKEPTWKPTKASDIKIGKKVAPAKPPPPAISDKDLKNLRNIQQSSSSSAKSTAGPVGNPSVDASYVSEITRFFDRKWSNPPNTSPSAATVVRVYISKWGTVTKTRKIQGSGDAAFDQAVMSLVESVKTVSKPPANYSYEYVEVEFRTR